ncbi:MAG TPA: hypothetical protein VF502_03120 [Stellaceae bacterium]
MESDPKAWKIARRLVATHGAAAMTLATDRARQRLAAGRIPSLLRWTRVSIVVAAMLDGRAVPERRRRGRSTLARVVDKVTRELREAGN